MDKRWKTLGLAALAAAAVGGIVALVIRDQISRHQRDLFSPLTFRRLAALGHISRERASVNTINLLRDFIAWEPRKMLRARAAGILDRMVEELAEADALLREGTA